MRGRQTVLGLRSPDPVLEMVAPIGLGASVGTALVVDVGAGRGPGNLRTMNELASDGPRLSELSPGRSGVAMMWGGGVDRESAVELIGQLSSRWPAVVVRVGDDDWPFPVIPVWPLYPGRVWPRPTVDHCVWQPVGAGAAPPGPGPVLPRLRPGVTSRILSGHIPGRSRWIAAWRRIWEMPWA